MATTYPEDALESLVDPALGIVFGFAWGDRADDFLEAHPDAELIRDDADVQEYLLPEPIDAFEEPVRLRLEFQLDLLITVRLDAEDGLTEDTLGEVLDAARDWFRMPIEFPDEGLAVAEEGATKLQVDLVDATVAFQDREL